MKRTICLLVFIPVILSAVVSSVVLEDQYRRKRRIVFRAKPVILLAGDTRKTARWIKQWAMALRGKLGDRARIYGLADLDGVPFFVSNNSIRNNLKKTCPRTTILCDWDGKVFKRLGFQEGYTVRVYSGKGRILGEVRGEYSAASLVRVLRLIR